MVGKSLSHYKITGELGRGGMGIVYKAEDTKLDRTVAIKVLPASALSNEEDRARFYREAKAAAQLHHPHIASVFEIDEAVPEGGSKDEPRPFIAMEYVDGIPVDQHIQKAPLKIDEAVRLATQVAGALEMAHEKNIVHRDIKSANVMLTAKGDAKVLDFGLAKTAQSTQITLVGSTMGTVAYMSPEQARGEEVDHRADLWSLGIMLYEMIAGRLPFATEYEQAAVYSILNEEPEPLTSVRTGVPMDLEYIVNKLLSKEKKHRYQGAAELVADLSAIKDTTRSRTSTQSIRATPPITTTETSRSTSFSFSWIHGLILLVAVALAWFIGTRDTESVSPLEQPMRLSLNLPDHLPMSFYGFGFGVEAVAFDVTDDGQRLVYTTRIDESTFLVSHLMGTDVFTLNEETEDASNPVFAPDGSQIAYFSETGLNIVALDSGRPRFLTSVSDPLDIFWSGDDWIYWSDHQGDVLKKIRPNGSSESEVELEEAGRIWSVSAGMNVGDLLLTREGGLVQHHDADGSTATIVQSGSSAMLFDQDFLITARAGNLTAGALYSSQKLPEEQSRVFLSDVRTGSIGGVSHVQITDSGTLFYASGSDVGLTELVIRNLDDSISKLPFEAQIHGHLDATRDGNLIVADLEDGSNRIVLYDLERENRTLFLQQAGANRPIINSAESSITYHVESDTGHAILTGEINSSQAAVVVIESSNLIIPTDWSSDDRFLLFAERAAEFAEIKVFDAEDGSITSLVRKDGTEVWAGKFSPDDSFVAYTWISGQGSRVIVQPFPTTEQQWTVSDGLGEESEWRDDSNELIFRSSAGWYSAPYSTDPVSFSRPQFLFDGPYVNISGMEFRVLDNGRVLLLEAMNKSRSTSRLVIVTNWADHAKRTLAAQD